MKNLFCLDMEMTGLKPKSDRILEVALVVIDLNFQIIDEYESIVFQSQKILSKMNGWSFEHHTKSGLITKIALGKPEQDVEKDLVQIIKKYSIAEPAILVGNSIAQDRKFIDQWMPTLAKELHYRMLDISSFKILFENKYNQFFEKKKNHRAIDDIKESIEELKFYSSFISLSVPN